MADTYRSSRLVRSQDNDCRITLGTMALALAGLGVAASISKTGASLTVGDDDHAPDQVTVATHTETTVTAQPAPPPAASA